MRRQMIFGVMSALVIAVSAVPEQSELTLPSVISDNMMPRREKPARVWGKSAIGATITVKFKCQAKTATVKNGDWMVELDAGEAGGPFEMIVTDGSETKNVKNILIGEVRIAKRMRSSSPSGGE